MTKEIDRKVHTLVCGASGYGKSALLDSLMFDDLASGKPVIFIDPKGDYESMKQFINLCRIADRKYHVFSEIYKDSISLNPVKDGNHNHLADRIHRSFDWSEEHYKTSCYTVLREACSIILEEDIRPSYKSILEKILEISDPYNSNSSYKRKDIQGIIMRLGNIVDSDFGENLNEEGLSFREIWNSNKCLYISLPVLGFPEVAPSLGRMILHDISYALYESYGTEERKTTPLAVYMDELSAIVTDQFIEILNKCRGAGMELTFAFQSPDDLSKVNKHLCMQILENASNWFILKQRTESSANLFSKSIGTVEGKKQTRRIQDGEEQAIGSQREVQELVAHSNIIKSLNVGQAILLRHNPVRVDLLNLKYIDPEVVGNNIRILENRELIPKIQIQKGVKMKKKNKKKRLSINEKLILKEVGRWKIILLEDLYNLIGLNKERTNFYARIRSLEENGYLGSKKMTLKNPFGKYVYLTYLGASKIKLKNFTQVENIDHDLICTTIMNRFLKDENIENGYLPRDNEFGVDPDGLLICTDGKKLAVEIELSQKSRVRIMDKFKRYGEETDIHKVLYIFNNKSHFLAYKKVLAGQKKIVQEKIVLNLDENLSMASEYDFKGSSWVDEMAFFKRFSL